jgi:hypothetical protein
VLVEMLPLRTMMRRIFTAKRIKMRWRSGE